MTTFTPPPELGCSTSARKCANAQLDKLGTSIVKNFWDSILTRNLVFNKDVSS